MTSRLFRDLNWASASLINGLHGWDSRLPERLASYLFIGFNCVVGEGSKGASAFRVWSISSSKYLCSPDIRTRLCFSLWASALGFAKGFEGFAQFTIPTRLIYVPPALPADFCILLLGELRPTGPALSQIIQKYDNHLRISCLWSAELVPTVDNGPINILKVTPIVIWDPKFSIFLILHVKRQDSID